MFTRSALMLALGLMAGSLFLSPVRAADDKSSTLSSKDQKYVQSDAEANAKEIYLGKLATQQATNDDVKQFAQKMVDDHTKANDQLKDIAKSKGYEIQDDKGKEDKAFAKLQKLSGDDFNKAYIDMMVKDHEKVAKALDDQSKNADDADVKKFASDILPTVQDHLKMAQDIQNKIGK